MNTPALRRLADLLLLLTHLGRRRLGGVIALALVLLWIWAAVTDFHIGGLGDHRMRFGGLSLTTTTSSLPR